MRWPGCMLVLFLLVASGCKHDPFTSRQGPNWQNSPDVTAQAAQLQDLQRRVDQISQLNRDLTAQLAQSKQQERLSKDETGLVKQQLREMVAQLKQQTQAYERSEQRLQAINASNRRHGAATIRANNSATRTLQTIDIPGYRVFSEGDVIRVEIPADQLFQPQTAQLKQTAVNALDTVSSAVARQYGQQRIIVEGHTDANRGAYQTTHELSAAQATAVFQQLALRGRLQRRQLTVMAEGDNQPRYSNATAAGQAANRRIELVIYPEQVR